MQKSEKMMSQFWGLVLRLNRRSERYMQKQSQIHRTLLLVWVSNKVLKVLKKLLFMPSFTILCSLEVQSSLFTKTTQQSLSLDKNN